MFEPDGTFFQTQLNSLRPEMISFYSCTLLNFIGRNSSSKYASFENSVFVFCPLFVHNDANAGAAKRLC